MDQYQFEQVIRRMTKRYGKIPKGKESMYLPMLEGMEHNLYRVWKENRACGSRWIPHAAALAMWQMEDRLTGKETDVSAFAAPENLPLRDAFLLSFDPFSSDYIANEMKQEGLDVSDTSLLEKLYRIPAMCMILIVESAEMWDKERGRDGYFLFVGDFLRTDMAVTKEVIQNPALFR
ncbi:MAG: hypothetical protein IJT94_10445 [Oscillibacter sp.]|nr:hypothetical protein [Oscillibacter sp.]